MARLRQAAVVAMAFAWLANGAAVAQPVPPASQVRPPVIAPPPATARISLPEVPAGAQIPEQAKKLKFILIDFDIEGEFKELAAERKALAAPLVGKRITVADVFVFADKLQQAYVRAGYPLVRVVIVRSSSQTGRAPSCGSSTALSSASMPPRSRSGCASAWPRW